jgi:CsoR family transcriptional regulator, copper-sensing transcriptional repressor
MQMDASEQSADTPSDERSTLTRLRRIEGQVRGLQRMVGTDADCSAILTQLLAVRAALDAVASRMVQVYAERCLAGTSDVETRDRLARVLQLFLRLS